MYTVLKHVLLTHDKAILTCLSAILRPKTSPISLLSLYTLVAISILVQLTDSPFKSRLQEVSPILELLIAISAILVILLMPLRNPDLPNDEISATSTPPTFELRSPEDNLTLWQFLSVSWMGPLITRGKRRQLHAEDVWKLSYEFQHRYLHDKFREVTGSVGWRLIKANCLDLIILTVLGVLDLLASKLIPEIGDWKC